MASSSASGTAGQLIKPLEYMNWLALGYALTTELCHILRPFINREMANFYQNLNTKLEGSGPCMCVFVARRKRNQFHDMGTCAWANVLQGHHHKNKPNWKRSDASKWLDPILGPWEIAKLFLPDLGGHLVIQNAEDMDITGILNLMYFCSHFTIPQHLIKDVRDIRNKWAHVPSLQITNAEIDIAFSAIENLLSDPAFAHDPGIKKVQKKVRDFSGLRIIEKQVLAHFREVIRKEISNLTTQLSILKEGSERKKRQKRLQKRQKMLEKAEALVGQTNLEATLLIISFFFFCYVLKKLLGVVKGIRRKNVVGWLMLLLLLLLPSPCAASSPTFSVYAFP